MYGGLITYFYIFSLDKNSIIAYEVDNVCVVPKPRLRDSFSTVSVRWTGRGLEVLTDWSLALLTAGAVYAPASSVRGPAV